MANVRAEGARAVVASLWSDSNQWNQVMANISHGTGIWLKVAAALRPGTDAGASEALDEAVFLALKANPIVTLQLLKDGSFEVDAVCSSNIGVDYTATQSKQFIQERINVLKGLGSGTGTVGAVRDQCLMGLRAALADLDK